MRTGSFLPLPIACLLLVAQAANAQDGGFQERVTELIERLDSDIAAQRESAEESLFSLAEQEQLLSCLPNTDNRTPTAIRAGIERAAAEAQRAIARRATAATEVSLQYAQAPLPEVLAEIERQTGNKLRDAREEFGAQGEPRTVTLTLERASFWEAADRVLDEARVAVYPYGEEDQLTLIDRPDGKRSRFGRGVYAGPFRFEPLRVVSTDGLRDANESELRVDLEVAWEPRLRPIALSQLLADLSIETDTGMPLGAVTPQQSIDLEVSPGSQTLEMVLSLLPAPADAKQIASMRGVMSALVPATRHTFRFEKVGQLEQAITLRQGDATITLERFAQQNSIWELHMRMRLDGAGDSLASHRGWVFRNPSYLVDPSGKRFEHAGFETTMQTENELGLAYLFDLSGDFSFDDAPRDPNSEPADPNTLTWVYETPTGVYTVPVEYEIGPIDLP